MLFAVDRGQSRRYESSYCAGLEVEVAQGRWRWFNAVRMAEVLPQLRLGLEKTNERQAEAAAEEAGRQARLDTRVGLPVAIADPRCYLSANKSFIHCRQGAR